MSYCIFLCGTKYLPKYISNVIFNSFQHILMWPSFLFFFLLPLLFSLQGMEPSPQMCQTSTLPLSYTLALISGWEFKKFLSLLFPSVSAHKSWCFNRKTPVLAESMLRTLNSDMPQVIHYGEKCFQCHRYEIDCKKAKGDSGNRYTGWRMSLWLLGTSLHSGLSCL